MTRAPSSSVVSFLGALAGLVSLGPAAGEGLQNKIVVAHRGASGYLPEHTLEAYAMAYAQGADFIEPDLVRTRGGAFICLHDIHLDATTDVEEVFPGRRRADGRWYAADLTLDEVRRLRVHERLDERFPKGAARFGVPTFEEMIELVQGLNRTTGRRVGIYPELKAPAWHAREGLAMEEDFLRLVRRYGYSGPEAPIFVQSFETASLERLRELGSRLRHVFLIDDGARVTEDGLKKLAGIVNGIGPFKGQLERSPEIVEWAHRLGLAVHPYTFRADALPEGYSSFEEELARFYVELDVDGVFTDFPDRTRAWLDASIAAAAAAAR